MLSREFAPERPKLAEPVEAQDDDGQVYVRVGAPPSYIRLGARAWSITRLLDGSRTVQQVAQEAGCTDDQVRRLLDQLQEQGLLDGSTVRQRHDSDVHRQSLFFLKFTWHNPRALAALYGAASRLLPLRTLGGVAAVLAVVGAAVCVLGWTDMVSQATESLDWSQTWQLWPAMLFRAVVHELGHAFACLAFGRSVAALGCGLYYFQPVAFTDVSDIWLLRGRWQRVLVHLGGPLVDLGLLIGSGVLVLTVSGGGVETFAAYLLISTAVGTAAGLNPLLRSDGYFVLTELLREDDLRERSLALLATTAPWRISVRDRQTAILVGYGALTFVYVVVILGIAANIGARFLLDSVFGVSDAVPSALTWIVSGALAATLWVVMLRRARRHLLA